MPPADPFTVDVLRRLDALERHVIPDLEGIEHRNQYALHVLDEGVPIGMADRFDHVGAGVTVSLLGSVATIDVPGGGGGGGGDWDLLQQIEVAGADAADIDFSSIDQTYRHLFFVGSLRKTIDASLTVKVQFNGITGNAYTTGRGIWAATFGTESFDVSDRSHVLHSLNEADHSAGLVAMGFMLVPYYSVTDRHKFFVQMAGYYEDDRVAGDRISASYGGGGNVNLLAAINRVRFFPLTGLFKVGSAITMYGIT